MSVVLVVKVSVLRWIPAPQKQQTVPPSRIIYPLVHVQHVRPYSAEAVAVGPTLLIRLLFFPFLVFAVFGSGFFLTGYEDGPQSKVIV